MPYSDPNAQKQYFRDYYKRNRRKKLSAAKANYLVNAGSISTKNASYRDVVLGHYGNSCTCCGTATRQFLCIDHINGGGHKHREQIKRRGSDFYRWLIQRDFPTGFQVLCHNCNMSKSYYGQCPHLSYPVTYETGGIACLQEVI